MHGSSYFSFVFFLWRWNFCHGTAANTTAEGESSSILELSRELGEIGLRRALRGATANALNMIVGEWRLANQSRIILRRF